MPRRFRSIALLLGLGWHAFALGDVAASPLTKDVAASPLTKKKKARPQSTPVVARKQVSRSAAPKRAAARHRHRLQHSTASFPADFERTPAFRYAQMEPAQCYAEARQRSLPTRIEAAPWPGLSAPMRLTGPLHGVSFRTDIAHEQRATSPYELFDCRLVLALDDFTRLLRAEGIHTVVMSSAYRPPPKSFEAEAQGKRHGGGLAIDMHRFEHDDGRTLKIDRDFHGRLGATVCGKTASPPVPSSEDARLLRRLACGAAERRLFQSILTPNYDPAHHNHFHFEITLGVRWFIVS